MRWRTPVGRQGLKLDPEQPVATPAVLVVIVLVIVAVTSIAGPVFVAIGEAGVLVRLLVFLLGLSLYLAEERRSWRAEPPTPVVVEAKALRSAGADEPPCPSHPPARRQPGTARPFPLRRSRR